MWSGVDRWSNTQVVSRSSSKRETTLLVCTKQPCLSAQNVYTPFFQASTAIHTLLSSVYIRFICIGFICFFFCNKASFVKGKAWLDFSLYTQKSRDGSGLCFLRLPLLTLRRSQKCLQYRLNVFNLYIRLYLSSSTFLSEVIFRVQPFYLFYLIISEVIFRYLFHIEWLWIIVWMTKDQVNQLKSLI